MHRNAVLKIRQVMLFYKYLLIWALELFRTLSEINFKGAHSGLRQFLTTESPLKMRKNAFYFILQALFFLKIFKFLFWLSGDV